MLAGYVAESVVAYIQYRTRQIGTFEICVLEVVVIKHGLTPSSSAAYLVQFVEALR